MKIPSKLVRKYWRRRSAGIWWALRYEYHKGYVDGFEYVEYFHRKRWYFLGVRVWTTDKHILRCEFVRWIHAVTVGPRVNYWLTWDQVNKINRNGGFEG